MIFNGFLLRHQTILRCRKQHSLIFIAKPLFSTNNAKQISQNSNNNNTFLHSIKVEIEKSREYCTDQYSKLVNNITKQKEKINELSNLVQTASHSINKITGYDTIQTLKSGIKSLEIKLYQDRILLEKENTNLKNLSKKQNHSQAVINDLLSRKSTWSPNDLKVFTDSYNENQKNIQELNEQSVKSAELEKLVKTMEQDLHNLILKRYHEEQIWSDKIRKLSTYGTLLLLVINLLSFFILHLIFEPRKRRRLVAAFEKETKDYIEEVKTQQTEQMLRLENLLSSKMELLFAMKEVNLEKEAAKPSLKRRFQQLVSWFNMIFSRALGSFYTTIFKL